MAFRIVRDNGDIIVNGLSNFDIESTFECGQCFRWNHTGDNEYTGVAGGRALRIKQDEGSIRLHGCTEAEFREIWAEYLDLATDYGEIIRILSKEDPVMERTAGYAPGIRILRQPVFETLVSFIISANNSIPNIKRVVERVSEAYGDRIVYEDNVYYSFPAPCRLAGASEDDVRGMKAGFRSPYIIKASGMFAENPVTVKTLKDMGYEKAKEKLMEYPGVGPKVADCTLLFSGAYPGAFPVDVWIKKIMETLYIGRETAPDEIAGYAKKQFGGLAGYAQQYLFHYARFNLRGSDS